MGADTLPAASEDGGPAAREPAPTAVNAPGTGPARAPGPALAGGLPVPGGADREMLSAAATAGMTDQAITSTVLVPRVIHPPAETAPADLTPAGAVAEPNADSDDVLSPGAAERIQRSLAANTRAAYTEHWRAFTRWCWLAGRTPLPASAQTLATYLDHLSRQPTHSGELPAPGTLSTALGCLQGVHKAAGQVADMRLARAVLTDYRRERDAAGHRTRKSLPITVPLLHVLVDETLNAVATRQITALRGLHTQVALVLGLALAGRSSEISALDIADIAFPGDHRMTITIRRSKTDQNIRTTVLNIQAGKHLETCPVRLTNAWIDTLAAHGITAGPLIRGLDRYGRLAGTPGHAARLPADGVPRISNTALNILIRAAVTRANAAVVARGRKPPLKEPERYSWHGLRAGFATSAGEANIPPTTVAERGRWKGLLMVMQYWRDGAAWRRQVEAEIGL